MRRTMQKRRLLLYISYFILVVVLFCVVLVALDRREFWGFLVQLSVLAAGSGCTAIGFMIMTVTGSTRISQRNYDDWESQRIVLGT